MWLWWVLAPWMKPLNFVYEQVGLMGELLEQEGVTVNASDLQVREWEGGHVNKITGVPSTKEIEPFVMRVRQDTCMKVKGKVSCVRLFASPWTVAYQAPLSMKSYRQDFLLQGIFPTQALNPGLPYCRQTLYHLSPQGNPTHVWELIKEKLWKNGWGVR